MNGELKHQEELMILSSVPCEGDDTSAALRACANRIYNDANMTDIGGRSGLLATDIPLAALDDMLLQCERIEVAVRQAMAFKASEDPANGWPMLLPEAPVSPSDHLPVRVRYRDGVLTITLPPTLVRDMSHSRVLPLSVKLALSRFVSAHGSPVIPQPAFVICRRKAFGYRQSYRDNENYESARAINAVMEVLGYTDRADHLGYISLLELVPDRSCACVELQFLSQEELIRRPELLRFRRKEAQ